MSQLVDDLIATKELLETKGWCKAARENEAGEHCLVGAVSQVTTGTPYPFYLGVPLDRGNNVLLTLGFNATIFPSSSAATRWNDDLFRTKRQVIRRINRAIRRAKRQK